MEKKVTIILTALLLGLVGGIAQGAVGDNFYEKPYTGSEPDTLLLYHFDEPDQAASIPAGYNIDPGAFAGGDWFTANGWSGGGYLSTFEGNSTTVSGTGAASLFSASDPVKTIEVWIKIDPGAFDDSDNFDTPWNEMQLCRFDGASGGGGYGGFILNTDNGTNQGTLMTSFNWEIGGAAESDPLIWQADTWYHLAWEFRNTGQSEAGVKFYRDGQFISLDTSGSGQIWSASGDIYWANHPAASPVDAGLQGLMDEFRVSNTAFTPVFIPVSISETDGSTVVSETGGTTDSFTIVLTEEPNVPVTITVDPETDDLFVNDNAEPNDPITLVFGTDNWDTPQAVTVKANDDDEAEGVEAVTVAIILASDNPDFAGTIGMSVTVMDNDSAGLTMVESDGSTEVVESGTTDTYTIVLTFAPTADVTITIDDSGDPNQVTVDGGETTTLTFTTSNWDTPQTVTVEAIDDDLAEANPHNTALTHSVSQPDGDNAYDGLSVSNVAVSVGENDCGAGPFAGSDLNEDCITNLLDFAIVAADYLLCTIAICD